MTFALTFEIYQPKPRLHSGDVYRYQPEIAPTMIPQIQQMGFEIELLLADSLYGESDTTFLGCLEELKLRFIVAIRSNHGVWLLHEQRVKHNRWRKFDRVFSVPTFISTLGERNCFWQKKISEILGNYYRPRNLTTKLNLLFDD